MVNVLYIHGYMGAANGSSATMIKKMLRTHKDYKFYSIDYNADSPMRTMQYIRDYVFNHHIDIVIGSSLGGWYALHLTDIAKVIVINPCLNPALELPKIGMNEDIAKYYTNDCAEFNKRIKNAYGLFADTDELFGNKYKEEFVNNISSNVYSIPGGHHVSKDAIPTLEKIILSF